MYNYIIWGENMQEQPYIISKKRTVRKIYWGRIIAVSVALSALIIGVTLYVFRTHGSITVDSRTYWLVSMGSYSDAASAKEKAEEVKLSGGAGYVYSADSFVVAASCYASEDDARTVCSRLDGAEVYSLSCPKLIVSKPKSGAAKLKELLKLPAKIFDELYDVSVKLDTSEIGESAAKYAALRLSSSCASYASECVDIGGDAGKYLYNVLSFASEKTESLAVESGDAGQRIKYLLCELAVKMCEGVAEFTLGAKI